MTETIHIGSIIKKVAEQQRISAVELADHLGLHRNNIYDIYKREGIDTNLLLKLSRFLKHDFFRYYSKELALEPTPAASETIAAYKQLVDELKERIKDKDALIESMKSNQQ
jgi:DNA-binding Xre family transcriptional regulator